MREGGEIIRWRNGDLRREKRQVLLCIVERGGARNEDGSSKFPPCCGYPRWAEERVGVTMFG